MSSVHVASLAGSTKQTPKTHTHFFDTIVDVAFMSLLRSLQGILSVTVIRARGLTGWQHEADPYVTLALMETAGESSDSKAKTAGATARLSMLQEQRSKTVYNEESPRWVLLREEHVIKLALTAES
jgi:hypothetical protein